MIVTLENNQEEIQVPEELEATLKKAMDIIARLEKLTDNTEVDITIVDNDEIHQLNRDYRGIDRPTDVLSFALDEGDEEPEVEDGEAEHLLGDVIISAPRAVEQGEEFGHGLNREMTYLAVHGMLHLLGYDHMEEADKQVMRAREEQVLRPRRSRCSGNWTWRKKSTEAEMALDAELFQAAVKARENAYIPYSHFGVGAAVRAKDGRIFTGCNIENASYGLTVCAERNAIFAAVKEGVREFAALCVTADTPAPVAPCGACRQVMAEFQIPVIYLTNLKGDVKETSLEELLPYSFDL